MENMRIQPPLWHLGSPRSFRTHITDDGPNGNSPIVRLPPDHLEQMWIA